MQNKTSLLFFNTLKGESLLFAFFMFPIILFSQCSYEPDFSDEAVVLTFSTDTIQFDTIFAERTSITKRLIIRNPSKNPVILDEIRLDMPNGPFSLTVNGIPGKQFTDEPLLAEDSLLVLIEATIDQTQENNPFVIRDQLAVSNNGNNQSIIIEAWGQNAHYLTDSVLTCNTTWTSEKPYVLQQNILIDSACSLTIEPGTRIYSGRDSFILVRGTLQVNGEKDSTVIFTNDRLDAPFNDAPGQWGGFIFFEGSKRNTFSFAEIKNSVVGLNLNTYDNDNEADVSIQNTIIGNTSSSAIIALYSDFEAVNSIIHTSPQPLAVHLGGGNAHYIHCTFSNSFSASRESASVLMSDFGVDNEETQYLNPLNITLINNIIYGPLQNELEIVENEAGNISLSMNNNLLKTSISSFDQFGNILNEQPLFNQASNYDFRLLENSPAINAALNTTLLIDFSGKERDENPDIGAWEFESINEDN